MAIELTCPCGRSLTLRDELAGKVIRCPQCQGALEVPAPAVEPLEVVEALEPLEVVEEAVAAGPPPLPRQEEYVEVELIEEGVSAGPPPLRGKPKAKYSAPPPPPAPDRPRPPEKRKKKGSVYSQYYGKGRKEGSVVFEEGWFGDANGGIVGGILMVLISLVIFGILVAAGARFVRAMIWTAVLFVIGLIAIFKGLMDMYQD
jgi:hypothetical protein